LTITAVKDKPPKLSQALRDFFPVLNAPGYCRRQVSSHEPLDKGHGRIETGKRHVMTSLPADRRRILHAVRTHWGIENSRHGCLDLTFGEEARPIRLRHSARNFSFLRRVALNFFRADKSRSISLPRKIKTAAYNPDYLAKAWQMRDICCPSPGNDTDIGHIRRHLMHNEACALRARRGKNRT
jgi:predicted transposase YbfD/YdcC